MSNLDYVVSTLAEGDLISAAFVDAKGEFYTVEGKVSLEPNAADYPAVKIGKVALATVGLFGSKHDKPKPVASLKQIVVIARAPQPFYVNRPVDRKAKAGDVFSIGNRNYYFDGILAYAVGTHELPDAPSALARRYGGKPKLISEKAAA